MRTVAIILNWRRAEETLVCVDSLLAIERDLDIVVLDNSSGDGSMERLGQGLAELVAGRGDDVRLVRAEPDGAIAWHRPGRTVALVDTGRNGGYAFGNNVGIKLAMARPETGYLWVLNNDTLIPGAATLDALLERMQEDATIGICGATVVYADRPDRIQTLAGCSFNPRLGRSHPIGFNQPRSEPVDRDAVERQLAYVNGAAAFVRRAFIERVGVMTESYFLYYEEIDWAWRARGSGFRLGFAPNALVMHQVGGSIGTDDFGGASPLSSYYLTRNRLRFLRRYVPASLALAIADMTREVGRAALRGHWPIVKSMSRALIGLPFRPS
jgi:GT2 family glycosyltransferase